MSATCLNLASVLEHHARQTPDRLAVICGPSRLAYAHPNAMACLGARWKELLAGFTGGDPEVQKGLNKMWADKANWPAKQREAYHIKPEIQAFITKAMTAT